MPHGLTASPSRKRVAVWIPRVLDWSIDYETPQSVWLVTDRAWYRLLTPAPEYAAIYRAGGQRKFDLCVRAVNALTVRPEPIPRPLISRGSLRLRPRSMLLAPPVPAPRVPALLVPAPGFLFSASRSLVLNTRALPCARVSLSAPRSPPPALFRGLRSGALHASVG